MSNDGTESKYLAGHISKGLVYVDKQYKHDMEEFEGIKRLCHRIVTENTPNSTLISSWKREIRSVLV